MLGQCRRQPSSERHVALLSTLRRADLAVPVGPPDTQLPLPEIDITPFEGDHLAAAQPGLAAEQYNQIRPPIDGPRDLHETFVLVEVVERRCALFDGPTAAALWAAASCAGAVGCGCLFSSEPQSMRSRSGESLGRRRVHPT